MTHERKNRTNRIVHVYIWQIAHKHTNKSTHQWLLSRWASHKSTSGSCVRNSIARWYSQPLAGNVVQSVHNKCAYGYRWETLCQHWPVCCTFLTIATWVSCAHIAQIFTNSVCVCDDIVCTFVCTLWRWQPFETGNSSLKINTINLHNNNNTYRHYIYNIILNHIYIYIWTSISIAPSLATWNKQLTYYRYPQLAN